MVLGAIVLLALCVVAFIGNSPLRAPLIAFLALIVLVGAGNWLNDYLGIKHKAQEFNRPDRSEDGSEAP